ncbi:MAG: thiamine phosphate synthase [bacterium]
MYFKHKNLSHAKVVNFRLYLISDRRQSQNRPLSEVIREACQAGIKAVQLREKDLPPISLYHLAREINEICQSNHTKLLINDRADIAQAVNADGIHLTSQSLPVETVRKCLTSLNIIGVSTHSLAEAQQAEASGCDFILFGPIFESPSKIAFGKPQGLKKLYELTKVVNVPIFAVGGIHPERAKQCVENGAAGVAVISAIMRAPDIHKIVKKFENSLGKL